MANKKGVSMIVLIISIIVMIILATIAIVAGNDAYGKAELAKFTSEFSDFSALVRKQYHTLGDKHASNLRTEDQMYYMIASGNDLEPGEEPVCAGKVSDIGVEILPDMLKGDDYFEITDDRNIQGWKEDKVWQYETEKHYVTDKGEVFILPGFLHKTIEGNMWYVNESKYYISENPLRVNNEVVTPPTDDNPVTPPVDDNPVTPPVDDNPVTPPAVDPQKPPVTHGTSLIVGGIRIRTIGNLEDMTETGVTISNGQVFLYGADAFYLSRQSVQIEPDSSKNDVDQVLSHGLNNNKVIKINHEKGFITPGPGTETGDLKLIDGKVYVFVQRGGGGWNNQNMWKELLTEEEEE